MLNFLKLGFCSVCLMQLYINSKVFLLDFKSKALTNQPMKNWEKFIDIFFYGPALVIGECNLESSANAISTISSRFISRFDEVNF